MAVSNTHFKQLTIGQNDYLIEAKYLTDSTTGTAKTYEDIKALINKAGRVVVLAELPAATAETYETYKDALVLVPSTEGGNVKDEYVIIDNGAGKDPRYAWEKVGDTHIDLSQYVQVGTYSGTAASDGAHTHGFTGEGTVDTVQLEVKNLSISRTTDAKAGSKQRKEALGTGATFTTTVLPTKKTISATASGVEVGSSGTATVLTGVMASSTKQVLGKDTSFSVSGGQFSGATQAVHAADSFTTNIPTTPAQVDVTKFGQGTLPTYSQGSKAAFSMAVTDGVLSFDFTANGDDTFTQGSLPSLGEGFYTAGTTGTAASYTQGTFTPNATGSISAISVSAGTGDLATAVTGVAGSSSATVLTGVRVTSQPTVNLTASTAAEVEGQTVSVATDIASATTAVNSQDVVNAVTAVTMLTQPEFELNGAAASGIQYANVTNTVGTQDVYVAGTTGSEGAHTHTTSTTLTHTPA